MTRLTAPLKLTADEFLAMPDDGHSYEHVNGELREKGMSQESGYVGGTIHNLLRNYATARMLGVVYPSDVGFRIPLRGDFAVKKPDVAFIAKGRITFESYLSKGFCEVVPDLVVEVVSPSDGSSTIQDKRKEWQASGVPLIWIVDPGDETIKTYRLGEPLKLFNTTDMIDAEPLIPGFTCSVSVLFAPPLL
jgi:Uma2 family endonuclease